MTDVISEKVGGDRVSIDNDTRAMIYGEYMQGVVKGEKNIIFINVSWGLGMGIIIFCNNPTFQIHLNNISIAFNLFEMNILYYLIMYDIYNVNRMDTYLLFFLL